MACRRWTWSGASLAGKAARRRLLYFGIISGWLNENDGDGLAPFAKPVKRGLDALQQATMWLAQHGPANPNDAGAAAADYLRLMGIVVVGWMWARMAKVAQAKLAANLPNARFYKDKLSAPNIGWSG